MSESKVDVNRAMRAMWLQSVKDFHGLSYDELALFDWYVKDSETTIAQMENAARADIEGQLATGREDVNDNEWVMVGYLAKRIRYSHVIYLASLGERHLKDTYDALKLVLGERVSLAIEDLQGEAWAKLPKYFQAFGQFSITDVVRKDIKALYDVRNVLVHQNGSITSLNEEKVSRLRNLDGIEIIDNEMVISQPFIQFARDALDALVTCLNDGLGQCIDRTVPFVNGKLKRVK